MVAATNRPDRVDAALLRPGGSPVRVRVPDRVRVRVRVSVRVRVTVRARVSVTGWGWDNRD